MKNIDNNLWILIEERPKKKVIKKIIEESSYNKNLNIVINISKLIQ
tara:strand:- start:51786 stop:51923 length:138 start_codon:yes stop_codon:yes gene_type:complete